MGPAFDPYYNWLGIPIAEQPPNYYRLLGLAPLESNPTVIDHAADRVMIHLRTFAAGPHGSESQQLLNEVATARVCLLDAGKKARYDADLQARLGLTAAPAATNGGTRLPPMPRASGGGNSGGANLPKAAALPPMPVQAMPVQAPAAVIAEEPIIAVNRAASKSVEVAAAVPRKAAPGRKPDEITNPQAAAIINTVKIVMGGLGGLSMAILLVWAVFGIDVLGMSGKNGTNNAQTAQNHPSTNPPSTNPSTKPSPEVPVDPTFPVPKVKTRPVKPAPTETTDPADPPELTTDPPEPVTPPSAFPPSTSAPSTPSTFPPSTPPTADPPSTRPKTAENPATPPKPVQPPENPPAPASPPKTAAPMDQRSPIPSDADQKAKLDEFRALYSKEFDSAERRPARDRFPEFLISKADAIKSDPAARFAILREAYNRSIKIKDFGLAAELVDRLEPEYQVDELAMRVHVLSMATAQGGQAAEKQSLALCAADLAELAFRRQRIDEALKLVEMADNMSKALQNKAFRERTIKLKEEVEKAHEEWGPVARARQTLAASPDDAAAALVDGRYRCLVTGDWATGLPVLAKGGDDPLAAAARLDLAGMSDSKSAAAVADAWFDLAKSDEKLKPLYARALHWYRQAVSNSTGADQVPWLQRVEQIEGLNLPERYFAAVNNTGASEPLPPFVSLFFRNVEFNAVDCMARIDPLVLKASPWSAYSANSIYSKPGLIKALIPTNVASIPREYQVGVRVRQYYSGPDGPFVVGMVGPKGQFAVVVDMPISTEFCTYITLADAKTPEQNPTLVRYDRQKLMFGDGGVLVQVRRNSIVVQIDNRVVTQYDGDLDRVVSADWTIPKFTGLRLGVHQGSYQVSSWFLEPVAPAPRLGKSVEAPVVPGLPNFPPSP